MHADSFGAETSDTSCFSGASEHLTEAAEQFIDKFPAALSFLPAYFLKAAGILRNN